MLQATAIFKILSDETRLRMLMLLYKESLCVCEFAGILEVPQPRISKNLAKLRDLNLVEDERREKFVFYELKKEETLLLEILKQLHVMIDHYPNCKNDLTRLRDKELYLNQCQIIIPSSVEASNNI